MHTLESNTVLTSSIFFHYNQANLDGAPRISISTTDQRSSVYVGGQETLHFAVGDNEIRTGLLGFYQHDTQLFDVLFNDGSSSPFAQTLSPSGGLVAAYVEDTYRWTPRLNLMGGLRESYFTSTGVTENATNPRLGFTYRIPGIEWVLRGFYEFLPGPAARHRLRSSPGLCPEQRLGLHSTAWRAGQGMAGRACDSGPGMDL